MCCSKIIMVPGTTLLKSFCFELYKQKYKLVGHLIRLVQNLYLMTQIKCFLIIGLSPMCKLLTAEGTKRRYTKLVVEMSCQISHNNGLWLKQWHIVVNFPSPDCQEIILLLQHAPVCPCIDKMMI